MDETKIEKRTKRKRRALRHGRIGERIRGTAERPRLVVSRTTNHIQGQIVDDDRGVTLTGISTRSGEVEPDPEGEESRGIAASRAAGRLLARRAVEQGISKVVFDRSGFPYHGRVRAFADGAREGGLEF